MNARGLMEWGVTIGGALLGVVVIIAAYRAGVGK